MDETASADEVRAELEELRASRARLVAAADDERRRIERGLHDGVQQHLVALAVNLQLARDIADSDPSALKALLDEIGQDVRDTLESVRTLAYNVYPPLLLDRGLVDALRGAAAEVGIVTRIDAEPTERYPDSVEASAYFCCLAALQDAAEHSGPSARATVSVMPSGGTLVLEISVKDGRGTPGETALANMRDRLGAVNGKLRVSAADGLTRIEGTIPLAP